MDSKTAIDRLSGLGRLRVWSLVVTIFGDAVRPRGGTAPTAALSELTSAIGIKPEAFRVAMSRLTRDNWVERTKVGRRSFYRLSAQGQETFAPATDRIYASAPANVTRWQLALGPAGDAPPDGFVELDGRVWLGPSDLPANGALVVAGAAAALPAWARDTVVPADIVEGYAALLEELARLASALPGLQPTPLEAAALRTLIVHHWRRLLLRHPDWPAEMFPEGWAGEACREKVLWLLDALDPAASEWFDGSITEPALTPAR